LIRQSDYRSNSKYAYEFIGCCQTGIICSRNLLLWQKNKKNKTLSKFDESILRKKNIKLTLEVKKCMAEARRVLPEKHWEDIQKTMQAKSRNKAVKFNNIFTSEMEWYNEQSSSDSESDVDDDMSDEQQNKNHAHVFMTDWEEEEEENNVDKDEDYGDENDAAGEDMLFLPSLIGVVKCEMLGLGEWMKDEKRLREGQANDALERLRDGLAHKALIYRSGLPNAHTTLGKTRLWGNAKLVQAKVRVSFESSLVFLLHLI
jgi:hypothetical protein